jgi:hypothetical protein
MSVARSPDVLAGSIDVGILAIDYHTGQSVAEVVGLVEDSFYYKDSLLIDVSPFLSPLLNLDGSQAIGKSTSFLKLQRDNKLSLLIDVPLSEFSIFLIADYR